MDEQIVRQEEAQRIQHAQEQEEQNRSRYFDDDDDDDDDYDKDGVDSYEAGRTTDLPVYLGGEDTGLGTHVVHNKYESFTMHSLKEQLGVLNTKKGIGSTNPIENAWVNTWRAGKFLFTGALYNLTHIFSWSKRQRERKKAVAKSMGGVALSFCKNLGKFVGGVAVSPLLTVYSAGKYLKNRYIDRDNALQTDSLLHEFGKKFYGYLWGGVVRNTINTVLMGATLPLWLLGGTIKTLWKAVWNKEAKGFQPAFDLPTPMMPKEWEDYYDWYSIPGGITKAFENEKDKDDEGKYKTRSLSNSWSEFCARVKNHFTRFRDANWHSFITGDMRNYSKDLRDDVDYNNMQQI